MQQKIYTTSTPGETLYLAAQVALTLRSGDVVLLKGDLGAGKSVFARGLIQAICGAETIVPSPTFTLVQTYAGPDFTLWHFDLYRIEHAHEIYELGIEEALETSVSLIEWPEQGGFAFPKEAYVIEFKYGSSETERILTLYGWGEADFTF